MMISTVALRAFDKIQHPLTIILNKVGIKGTYYNTIKVICDRPIANTQHFL